MTGTPISTTSSFSACASPDISNITCLGSNAAEANSSLFPIPEGAGKRFQQLHGINLSGDQAANVCSIEVTSMDAYTDAYTAQAGYAGAGFGYPEDNSGTGHTCWIKPITAK